MRLKLYATAAVAALAATVSLSLSPAHAGTSGPAPLLARAEAVPGSYLVVLRPSVSTATASAAFAQAVDLGGSVAHRYSHVLDGFAATLSDDAVEALRRNPSVAYIEPDAVWHRDTAVALQDTQTPPDGAWGLDRVDQRTLPLSTTYTYTSTGEGVNAYIIDSGIRDTHEDFGGRAEGVLDLVGDGMGTADCTGHGTPIAGMIGGASYGVAKDVQLKAVRIWACDGTSTTATIVAAMDWVAANHVDPAVVNLSLNGPQTASLDQAMAGLINAGVPTVHSAGNNMRNACDFSPRHPDAVTVGGMELTVTGERKRGLSNGGPCVDLHAPGAALRGPAGTGDTAVSELRNGTSYAAPHVVGIIARHLQNNPGLTPQQAQALVVSQATAGQLDPATLDGAPNLIAYIDPNS